MKETFYDPYTWVCVTLEWPVKAFAIIFLVKKKIDRVWIDTFPFYGLVKSVLRKSVALIYRLTTKEKNLTPVE